MSDRLEFYEVQNKYRQHVCLCKNEEDAIRIANKEEELSGVKHYVEHVEIVATTDLDIQEY